MTRPTRRALEKEIEQLSGTDIDVDDLPKLNLAELIMATEIEEVETPEGEPHLTRLDGKLYRPSGVDEETIERALSSVRDR